MPFWRLYYHLVWATYRRVPFLAGDVERQVYGTLLGKAEDLGVLVHAIGSVEDHVHLAVSIPPRLAVADCVRHFKGASAHYVNHLPGAPGNFGWQGGCGVLTFGDRSLARVVAYVKNQKQHHQQQSTIVLYERLMTENDGPAVTVPPHNESCG